MVAGLLSTGNCPMSKLSDTQLVILSAACQRSNLSVYPLATKLPGAAATKVLTSLLGKGLIEEIDANRDDTVWREDEQRGRGDVRGLHQVGGEEVHYLAPPAAGSSFFSLWKAREKRSASIF